MADQGSGVSIETTAALSVVGYVINLFKIIFPFCMVLNFSDISLPESIFVEKPSEDFFCPVTLNLMFQPHLTSCCGQHLSLEAVIKIKRGNGPCPLCKMHPHQWSTMLDKYFQQEVNSLQVFCHHKNRECTWQGDLIKLNSHLQECPEIKLLRGHL